MKTCKFLAASACIVLGVMTAATANAATIFEGRVFVTAVTAKCSNVFMFVGNNFTSVFRPKIVAADPAEGLSIVYPSAASVLISKAASGRLVNSPAVLTNFQGTLVGINATPITWLATATLLKAPASVTASTPAVTITGTIDDFNIAGCTITIRGAYARRP
jgi:hypothetical protein